MSGTGDEQACKSVLGNSIRLGGILPGVGNQHKRDQWLQDIEARQRNVVFPDTLQNETRFWRNLGKQPFTPSIKVGLALLAIFGWGFFAFILFATFQEGVTWEFALGMILFCGPIFGAIAWATRRSLRSVENSRRGPRMRKH